MSIDIDPAGLGHGNSRVPTSCQYCRGKQQHGDKSRLYMQAEPVVSTCRGLHCTVRQGNRNSPSLCTTFRPLLSNHSLSVMFINCRFWNGRPCGFKKLLNLRVLSTDVADRPVCWRNNAVSVTKIIRCRRTRYVLFLRVSASLRFLCCNFDCLQAAF